MPKGNPHPVASWKPGQVQNPGGRPKCHLSKTLAKLLNSRCPGKKWTNTELLCKKVMELAQDGDKEMIRFVFDRMEGMLTPSISATANDVPLVFKLALGEK
jgi:hypothetical protein